MYLCMLSLPPRIHKDSSLPCDSYYINLLFRIDSLLQVCHSHPSIWRLWNKLAWRTFCGAQGQKERALLFYFLVLFKSCIPWPCLIHLRVVYIWNTPQNDQTSCNHSVCNLHTSLQPISVLSVRRLNTSRCEDLPLDTEVRSRGSNFSAAGCGNWWVIHQWKHRGWYG